MTNPHIPSSSNADAWDISVESKRCNCLTEEDVRRIAAEVFIEVLEKMAKRYKFENRGLDD